MGSDDPSSLRVAAGATAAMVAAAAAAALFMTALGGWSNAGLGILAFVFGAVIALLHLLVLALPLYCVLRRRWALTWWRALIAGLAVGGVPMTVAALLDGASLEEGSGLLFLAWLPGGVGGLAFWAVLRLVPHRKPQLEGAARSALS